MSMTDQERFDAIAKLDAEIPTNQSTVAEKYVQILGNDVGGDIVGMDEHSERSGAVGFSRWIDVVDGADPALTHRYTYKKDGQGNISTGWAEYRTDTP